MTLWPKNPGMVGLKILGDSNNRGRIYPGFFQTVESEGLCEDNPGF
jgi:hypothetical protein